ncbi:hypothetical protein [Symbiopectobacterium sp. RP]|uniref:hypothetical protein n=1 Tax=Symbiopectobacterium sp. RP TaxID=3248553 RepID=UPI003D2A25EC
MITANALICGKKIQLIVIKIMSLGYIRRAFKKAADIVFAANCLYLASAMICATPLFNPLNWFNTSARHKLRQSMRVASENASIVPVFACLM